MPMEANSSFLFPAPVPPLCGVTPPRAIMGDADFPSSLFPRRAYYLVAIRSFIQIFLLRTLLSVRLCARHAEDNGDQDRLGSYSLGTYILIGEADKAIQLTSN